MINFLKIQNFKSLRNVQFDFRNLNLLMGLNSMGKSSVIQSLLILRQSYIKENSLYKLYTNGDLIKLGNSKDIFFQNAATDESICFEIENEISKKVREKLDNNQNIILRIRLMYLRLKKLETKMKVNYRLLMNSFII